ncbi:MAG: shikimate kinase [Campylobacterota bacterium]
MKNNNIVLIGFMGVGKGSIARQLVKQSERFGLDTDDLIESLENQKIKAIFENEGEAYFRALEQKCAFWLQNSVKDSVISTGGGFYQVDNLNEIGQVVYLKADFDWIYKRVTQAKNASKKLKKRPLFKSYKKTKELFQNRQDLYEQKAKINISVDKEGEQTEVQSILES